MSDDLFKAPYHSFVEGTTPGSARAGCNRCGTEFDYIPLKLNSTKGSYPDYEHYPKCPNCNSWRDTIVLER